MNYRKVVNVSGAVILRTNSDSGKKEIFATRRGYGDYKGFWEFPGGKIEPGESPEDCVVREIHEELTAGISVIRKLGTVDYDYPQFHLTMHCFLCSVTSGRLELLEHDEARWLDAASLASVEWLPADIMILDPVKKELE